MILNNLSKGLLLGIILIIPLKLSIGQISQEGEPYSFQHDLDEKVPIERVKTLDVQKALEEDIEKGISNRFSKAINVEINLDNSGEWTNLEDGSRVWRLAIESKGAYSINLTYDNFYMPNGGRFYIYNADTSMVRGAFTKRNNKNYGSEENPIRHFSTAPVSGSKIILEYYEPYYSKGKGSINIATVARDYRNFFGLKPTTNKSKSSNTSNKLQGFGDSQSCNININCSPGASWQDKKRSVAMVLLDDGTRWGSGSLMNNTKEDLTPYFLTAEHVIVDDPSKFIFMFNYESPDCSNTNGPTNQTISGAHANAKSFDNADFGLLELSEKPPASYNTYYNGWNATPFNLNEATTIHHPAGDIKKISLDLDAPTLTTYEILHYDIEMYYVKDWDYGTTEGGSSGAPLYDQDERVRGQVSEGDNDPHCEDNPGRGTYFGRMSSSWQNGHQHNSLKPWLDPNDVSGGTWNGMEGPDMTTSITTNSKAKTRKGDKITFNATVTGADQVTDFKWKFKYGNKPWSKEVSTNQSYKHEVKEGKKLKVKVKVSSYNQPDAYDTYTYDLNNYTNFDKKKGQEKPINVDLKPNYPNPFNPTTNIRFRLDKESNVSLVVYNLNGKKISTIIEGKMDAGLHNVTFNALDLTSGTYIYKLTTNSGFSESKRMTVLK